MTDEEYKQEAPTLRPMLLNTAETLLKNGDDAADAVQDVLLKLWDMREELRCPMAPLARVVLRNLCIDRLRRHRVSAIAADVELQTQPPDAENQELSEQLMTVIDSLPARQQVVIRLRHIEGMDFETISNLTGCSVDAVRQALSRARRAVMKRFNE